MEIINLKSYKAKKNRKATEKVELGKLDESLIRQQEWIHRFFSEFPPEVIKPKFSNNGGNNDS